jgi:peptide/nickel transport system ATP-binding protein
MRVADIVEEPLVIHRVGTRGERAARVRGLLDMVGLDAAQGRRYPHELSGGQRQRIGIARAIALQPSLIVADEPVSALDVSVQAQVVNLLLELRQRLGLMHLFIAHDLRLVQQISDRVAVMYRGRLVEVAAAEALFSNPVHPHTQALLSAIPAGAGRNDPPDSLWRVELGRCAAQRGGRRTFAAV